MILPSFLRNLALAGVLTVDSTTGLISIGGTDLVATNVDTVSELLLLNTMTYDKQRVIVNNPGGNTGYGWGTVAGIPAPAYCYNGAWHWESGKTILGIYAETLQLVVPAATFTSATPSDNAGLVKLTSVGVHGLTAAACITTQSKIRITGGTNWTPGDYNITVITLDTVGTDITINYPYSASLGTPTIVLAHATNEVEIVRCKLPQPFTTRARYDIEGTVKAPVTPGAATWVRTYLADSGASYTAGTLITSSNLSGGANTLSMQGGFSVQKSLSVQKGRYIALSSPIGLGIASIADVPTATVDLTSGADFVVTGLFTSANSPLRYDGFMWSMKDA